MKQVKRGLLVAVQRVDTSAALPSVAEIRRWVGAAAGSQAHGELTVRIVGEQESAALNARYRRRPGATNVLAFPAGVETPVPDGEPRPIGDLIVCAPVVAREAREQGKALPAHWAHIVIHGTLHLFGYDHERDSDARAMEDRERELLAGFGFDDPYLLERQ